MEITISKQIVHGATIETVNARNLHVNLEITQKFGNWIKYQIRRFGLVKGEDYLSNNVVTQVPHQGGMREDTITEYYLTIDMAKRIAQNSMTKKGAEVREQLLALAKDARVALKKQVYDEVFNEIFDNLSTHLRAEYQDKLEKTAITWVDEAELGQLASAAKAFLARDIKGLLAKRIRNTIDGEIEAILADNVTYKTKVAKVTAIMEMWAKAYDDILGLESIDARMKRLLVIPHASRTGARLEDFVTKGRILPGETGKVYLERKAQVKALITQSKPEALIS